MLQTRSQNTVHCNCLHFRDTIGYHSNNMTTYTENTFPEEGQAEVFYLPCSVSLDNKVKVGQFSPVMLIKTKIRLIKMVVISRA